MPTAKQMKIVWKMLSVDSRTVVPLESKVKRNWHCSVSLRASAVGTMCSRSEHRSSLQIEHLEQLPPEGSTPRCRGTPTKLRHRSTQGSARRALASAGSGTTG